MRGREGGTGAVGGDAADNLLSWLHLLRCFPAAEQLSPATSDQPSALRGQAAAVMGSPYPAGGTLEGGRVLGRPVAVSHIKPRQAATRVFGHLDRRDGSAAFFSPPQQRAKQRTISMLSCSATFDWR